MYAIIIEETHKNTVADLCKTAKKKLYQKKYNFLKKSLAMPINSMYTNPCCGMIAVKREVAGSQ